MKSRTLIRTAVLVIALLMSANVFTQEVKNDEQPTQQNLQQGPDNKITLLRHLGLTRPQIQQIRRINAERKPLMDAAQERLRQATRQLDERIYADSDAEGEFQERLKAVQLAQAEVSRIKFVNELAIRRVLTEEQLVKFRELRRRFEAAQQNNQDRLRERMLNRQNQPNATRPMQNDPNLRQLMRQRQEQRQDQQKPKQSPTRPQ